MNRKARIIAFIVVIYVLVFGIGYTLGFHNTKQISQTNVVGGLPAAGSVRVFYSLDKKQNDKELISLINNAHKYIYFAIYEFTLSDVADALVRAKERGVDVRGIVDRENSTTSYEAPIIKKLTAAGIPIETQTHPNGIMHIKALVTENAYASGSYNWTNSATNINDEVLEVGTDKALRARYEAILKQLLSANSAGVVGASGATNVTTQVAPKASGVYDYTNAGKHIGQIASVHGTIVSVYTAKSGTTFFDYCVNYSGCPFGAVIFASDKPKFDSLIRYQGQNITITGTITSYNNRAEIVLNNPNQISK